MSRCEHSRLPERKHKSEKEKPGPCGRTFLNLPFPRKRLRAMSPIRGKVERAKTAAVLEDHGLVGEALKGDDVSLEFHEDRYPRLPDCLDRRPKPLLTQA